MQHLERGIEALHFCDCLLLSGGALATFWMDGARTRDAKPILLAVVVVMMTGSISVLAQTFDSIVSCRVKKGRISPVEFCKAALSPWAHTRASVLPESGAGVLRPQAGLA